MNARIIITFILFTTLINSCVSWNENGNYVDEIRRPLARAGDVYIFSMIDKSKTDSFTVRNYVELYDYEFDIERISFALNNPRVDAKYFIIDIQYDACGIGSPGAGIIIYFDEDTGPYTIGEVEYDDVYTYEIESEGNSDTIINLYRYCNKSGLIAYRYENDEEYLLDTIIIANSK